MFKFRHFIALLFVTNFALSGCTGLQMGDVLAPPTNNVGVPAAPVFISLKTFSNPSPYKYPKPRDVSLMAAQVFQQYGWSVQDRGRAAISVTLRTERAQYDYPQFAIPSTATLFMFPAKAEVYIKTVATIEIDGVSPETLTYYGSVTRYGSLSPFALMIPGVIERSVSPDEPLDGLQSQSLKRTLQHIAKDIKAKYLSGNYQRVEI